LFFLKKYVLIFLHPIREVIGEGKSPYKKRYALRKRKGLWAENEMRESKFLVQGEGIALGRTDKSRLKGS